MDLLALFEKLGLPVAFLAVMIRIHQKSEEKNSEERKSHKDERSEWRQSQERLQDSTNQALRELTNAIIKLESKDKKDT